MNKFFKDGATVLFQGDSVTDCGRNRNHACMTMARFGSGYPRIFKEIYDRLFPCNSINFVNRGVSGDRVRDLLTRYDVDFKAVNPDFVSIMIGINDTWRAYDSADYCAPERFEKEYDELLSKIKADFPDAKIMIIEPFAFTAHPDRLGWNADLDPKRDIVKKLADKYADYFVPMYDLMTDTDKNGFDMYELSTDGVHPDPVGHSLIATELIKTLGII
ncbi:MAG: SGNH/GDSL hydrolase family protein [Clostridia bacterium]|nr:SGNH/GDSL hydrolase family protein [Clostridia bacterium]